MTARSRRAERFTGRIGAFGTGSGTRVVLGLWERSPFGAFADAMIEDARGHRTLLAPRAEVADFVAATYSFDEVRIVPLRVWRIRGGLAVGDGMHDAGGGAAPAFRARLLAGRLTPLGRVLRAVPSRLATSPAWLTAVDPVARILVPGVRTAGTAGGGRREYYGVTAVRSIVWAEAHLDGRDLGAFGPLAPPVRFGFGSAPASPALVDLTTTVTR
ncbi:hypothetical protein N1031_17950 [Herbiconiux moechotypicola]|uniref:Uncharacterized protein n=1 Tax=Herbiconiux moechotypicola TaxID=637393 RepID=A0ABN3E4R9_9MICO|nr:hypothetical protein [Herbiconiux moechotypicola]MCS5731644.1 hypothetical protein [Herbiconiux moechotypicola]